MSDAAPTPMQVTLLIAHGSRHPDAGTAHRQLCDRVDEQLARRHQGHVPGSVRAAFLEIDEPSLGDAIATAAADGTQRVVVVPHFLSPGNHVRNDIPALVDTARAAHPQIIIELRTHLGDDPRLVDLLADLAG